MNERRWREERCDLCGDSTSNTEEEGLDGLTPAQARVAKDGTRSRAWWGGPQSSAGAASGRRVHQRPGVPLDPVVFGKPCLGATCRVACGGAGEVPVTWTRGGSGVVGEWSWSGVQERSGPVVLCKCGGSVRMHLASLYSGLSQKAEHKRHMGHDLGDPRRVNCEESGRDSLHQPRT